MQILHKFYFSIFLYNCLLVYSCRPFLLMTHNIYIYIWSLKTRPYPHCFSEIVQYLLYFFFFCPSSPNDIPWSSSHQTLLSFAISTLPPHFPCPPHIIHLSQILISMCFRTSISSVLWVPGEGLSSCAINRFSQCVSYSTPVSFPHLLMPWSVRSSLHACPSGDYVIWF